MIVSASHRTDIPAFYGDWFRSRLAAGFCEVASPFGGQTYRVALEPAAVDGFVFWTRNVAPFLPILAEIRPRYPFVVQHTLTGYSRELDQFVPAPERTLPALRAVAAAHGPDAL